MMDKRRAPPRRPGRPRDAAKRAEIVKAAWAMFLDQGLHATSLDSVAKAAGVSRVTLYSHFPDKTALFETAIQDEMQRLAENQMPLVDVDLKTGLIAFGQALMHYLTSPLVVSFYSVLAGELRRHPDLARRFYELGPGQTHRNLTSILKQAAERGEIIVPSAEIAAEQLIGLWQGLSNYRLVHDVGIDHMRSGVDGWVNQAVTTFLAAYGSRR